MEGIQPVTRVPETGPKWQFERASVINFLQEIGLAVSDISEPTLERLVQLERLSHFIGDEKRAVEGARTVFEYAEGSEAEFSESDKRAVELGTFFSDIGKTGPANATPEQQSLILSMYAVENVRTPQMTVEEFYAEYYAYDVERRVAAFRGMDLDPQMTMREFWNLHTHWTYDILMTEEALPREAIIGASMHHTLEGTNPGDILQEDGTYTEPFGERTRFGMPEKMVILLDKYDAFRRRSGCTHEKAVNIIGTIIQRNERFADDKEFAAALELLDHSLSNNYTEKLEFIN